MKRVLVPLVLALLAAARPAAAVCTAADVMACGPNCWKCVGNTCTLGKLLTVTPPMPGAPCTFDFGTRDVVLNSGGFTAGQNAFEIKAHGLTVDGSGTLKATGNQLTPGGMITLTLGSGGLMVLASANLIDLTGAEVTGNPLAGGGTFTVQSDGDVVLGGGIAVDGTTPNAQGGSILVTAGRYAGTVLAAAGNVTVSANLTATGKANGPGGMVTLTANGGKVDVEDRIDVSGGGGGGSICTTSDGDTTLGTTPTGGPLLVADGAMSGDAASGGCIDVFSSGNVTGKNGVTGRLLARGSNAFITTDGGGCGGMIDIEALGPVMLEGGSNGGVDASGGQLGGGGTICVSTDNIGSDLTVGVPLAASAAGLGSVGGCVDVCSGGRAVVQDDIDASANCGGAVCVDAFFDTSLAAPAQAIRADGGGNVEVSGGGLVTLAGPLLSAAQSSSVPGSPGGGVTVLAGGSISASVPVDVSAFGPNNGGSVDVSAGKDLAIDASSTLNADGGRSGGLGGAISLRAGDPDLPGNLALNGLAHATGTSPPNTPNPALGLLQACTIHVGATGVLDTRGDTLATNTLIARTGITVDPGALVATTGADAKSRNFVILPTGAPTPNPGAFSPPLAPTDVQFRAVCTGPNQPAGCLIPCPTCGNGQTEYPETCDNGAANGTCQPCSAICRTFSCDDHNACTTDSCNPATGQCEHVDTVTPTCDDHNNCTFEQCNTVTGQCETTFVQTCNDMNQCTTDACAPADGSCSHTPIPGCTTTTTTLPTTSTTSTTTTAPSASTTTVTQPPTTTTTGAAPTTTVTQPPTTSTTVGTPTTTTLLATTSTTGVSSTTSSTTTASSSTSTTQPPECTPDAPAACDDLDLCTRDSCLGGRCVHEPLLSFDAVLCRLDGITAALQAAPATAVGGNRPQHKLENAIVKARALTVAGQTAQGKRRVKQLGKAGRKLGAFIRAVMKGTRASKIQPGLGARLLSLASGAMSELTPLRTGS